MVLLNLGLSIPELFVVIAGLNALVAIYIFSLLPEFLMRFLAWIMISVVYRPRPTGLENIPAKGPAVVVCNHVSYIDPIILSGSIQRPMRFVMWYKIFQMPLLNLIFRTMKAIPIAGAREDETVMNEAFEKVDWHGRPERPREDLTRGLNVAVTSTIDEGADDGSKVFGSDRGK